MRNPVYLSPEHVGIEARRIENAIHRLQLATPRSRVTSGARTRPTSPERYLGLCRLAVLEGANLPDSDWDRFMEISEYARGASDEELQELVIGCSRKLAFWLHLMDTLVSLKNLRESYQKEIQPDQHGSLPLRTLSVR